ncbi:fimbrial biogenesis outer membrane usher protein [Enterobacter sp. E-TC7]|uniref:Fimbrial biogenesis outer membrane usher protein n=1 Tax=Enterobacter nematophilus TaxID=2994648 RepID=A0ABT3VWG1_9ENTR|nr:fimbria/pilus outer membrane usher protein [Enterobacter nematophilus]MCX5574095.1 fimbrial biogenesis outer membrane usher protein [Enterobacter nematophilus]
MTKGLRLFHDKYNVPSAPVLCCISGALLLSSGNIYAREYLFSPSSLEGDALTQQDIDLSLFSKENSQLPGRYSSHIRINTMRLRDQDITYKSSDTGELIAQISPDMLRQWGVDVDKYPSLAKLEGQTPLTKPLSDFIPFASSSLDFSEMTLNLSIPQAALLSDSPDFIAPSRWNDGVPVMFADYAFSGSQHKDSAKNATSSQYLNLRSGANLGGWRLRNYSTWNNTEDASSWDSINTFLQHDIDVLRAQFTAGENSTRGEVFDSLQYRGVNLVSDEEMLPYSQRGFAPVIRGIASSNAEVSVRQNGYLIYQQNVAPGAFEINDLYSTTNSGDLEVTIKEADGSEHHFTQPYSSIAVMQRPDHLKYEFTAARYRADSGSDQKEPLFVQGSVIYGLNNTVTLFGGLTASEDYQALNSGAGIALGPLGSLSADVTMAKTRLDNNDESTGQSYRLLYSGKVDTTGTNFTLASYRYSTSGYYSFADATQKYDDNEDNWLYRYNKRNRIQASISQNVLGSSVYLNGYQQDYWGTSLKERNLSAGFNTVVDGISMHMAYTYSKNNDDSADRMVSFGISMPLSRWLPRAWSSYTISNTRHGYTRQNLGINGTLLDDERMSYSLQQSRSNHDGEDTSSVYSNYRSRYANLNVGYYYSSDNTQQFNYGVSGAVVAHPHGVTLAQPLGNQFAIVNAEGAEGVRFKNQRGIQTDWQGNAVIPSLTPYQENRIRIDTTSLPEDVDTSETAITVIPSRSAAVVASFDAHVGYRALITLTRPDGRNVPFGAIASVSQSDISGIVDDTGTLYLAGIGEESQVKVSWGNATEQQCIAHISLNSSQGLTGPTGIRYARVICQQEQQHVN